MSNPYQPPAESSDPSVVEFNVVLSTPQPKRGFFDNRSSYPVPLLGPDCVCCALPATTKVEYDPGDSQQLTSKIAIPVCDECAQHLRLGRFAEGMMALGGGLGGVMAFIGLFMLFAGEGPWLLLIGLAGVGLGAGWYWALTFLNVRRARQGHHRMFEMWVGPGFCGVRTTNAKLAAHLKSMHGSAVSLTETPR